MFELVINAVKLATSKEARESVSSLVTALKRSPEWKKDLCELEAMAEAGREEHFLLLKDLAGGKLRSLGYTDQGIDDFCIAFEELTRNARQHGACEDSEIITLVMEFSQTFSAITVFNPADRPADIVAWLSLAQAHLIETKRKGRGRGLILTFRKSDGLERVGATGVKAMFYRDQVQLGTLFSRDTAVVIVLGGHSNPSLGRRLADHARSIEAEKIVLCLSPHHLPERLSRDLHLSQGSLRKILIEEIGDDMHEAWELALSENPRKASSTSSQVTMIGLDILGAWARLRQKDPAKTVRLICDDKDLEDLLPRDIISRSVSEALKELSAPPQS